MATATTTIEEIKEQIVTHLRAGGAVRVGTQLRYTDYRTKHADWFFVDAKGNLRVRSGRSSLCLSFGDRLLVSIRFSKL